MRVKAMVSVSYVVTLYNKEPFVPFVLEGLKAQAGGFEKQFVFVDDGSRDRTLAVLRDMTAGWSNVTIIAQANAGPSDALNRAIDAATGDYIKPVDGDDVLAPWATRRLMEVIQEYRCGVAYGFMPSQGSYSIEEHSPSGLLKTATEQEGPVSKIDPALPASLRAAKTNPSAWLASRRAVGDGLRCDPGVFVQDSSIELRLAARTPFARVDQHLFWLAAGAPDRVSGSDAQILHDVNLALIRFLRANPGLDPRLVRYGLRRAAGRGWIWARRRGGKGVLSPAFLYNLLALAGLLGPGPGIEAALCQPFRETDSIRLMEALADGA
jgi:hypothetical protein